MAGNLGLPDIGFEFKILSSATKAWECHRMKFSIAILALPCQMSMQHWLTTTTIKKKSDRILRQELPLYKRYKLKHRLYYSKNLRIGNDQKAMQRGLGGPPHERLHQDRSDSIWMKVLAMPSAESLGLISVISLGQSLRDHSKLSIQNSKTPHDSIIR
ncbi:hypothetical protein LYNGBM3L_52140 [Moorena producens 3L]|uniref:Uncharacterized protein n=2 Tax=Moorena TaxID=1155738 RepID=F4XYN1_9CYAN|nr:hypothetical protein LYNGBM3L_52140 [Moorena producens 3L]